MFKILNNFNVPITIFKSENKKVNGINTKVFTEIGNAFCSFRGFGGTEKVINDMIVVEDTAVVELFYNPQIKNDCKLVLPLDNNSEWEILSVENIDMRNQYLKLRVRRLKGNA